MNKKNAIVVGAGIVGLAAARALAVKGYKVDVLEKSGWAAGASVRNFGMVWPIGQPSGKLYERAIRSRDIWQQTCDAAKIWYARKGSIHLAYEAEEMDVISEFVDRSAKVRDCNMLTPADARKIAPAINPAGLLGGFYSGDELIVNAREAIRELPVFLKAKYDVDFHFGHPVTEVSYPNVYVGDQVFSADRIFVCSGPEFESLYPDLYLNSPLTRCKLQMMRTVSQGQNFTIGPALCGGLTLLHYGAFKECHSLTALDRRINDLYPEYVEKGIHVMLSQNQYNEVIIGDSHEYGLTLDCFNRKEINDLILAYLRKFVILHNWTVNQSWIGVYTKMLQGTELVIHPEDGVTIVNGLGGAGMTLSFGLLEEIMESSY